MKCLPDGYDTTGYNQIRLVLYYRNHWICCYIRYKQACDLGDSLDFLEQPGSQPCVPYGMCVWPTALLYEAPCLGHPLCIQHDISTAIQLLHQLRTSIIIHHTVHSTSSNQLMWQPRTISKSQQGPQHPTWNPHCQRRPQVTQHTASLNLQWILSAKKTGCLKTVCSTSRQAFLKTDSLPAVARRSVFWKS